MIETRALETNQIHLWWVQPSTVTSPDILAKYRAILTIEEKAKVDRFVHEKSRHQALVTRALIRHTLSHYFPTIHPATWRFKIGDKGKPELIPLPNLPCIRFNLSHTHDFIVCGLCLECDIGVDVESIQRDGADKHHIARRFFAAPEIEQLKQHSPIRFFDFWTLKEAYIKATGQGLSTPLNQFWFTLGDSGKPSPDISIHFSSELNDQADKWQFWLTDIAHYRIAIALKSVQREKRQTNLSICPVFFHFC